MAKAKKLPSGNWRVLVYAGTIDGKRKYESFTASTKKEADYLAAAYAAKNKEKQTSQMTIGDAVDEYINSKDAVLSPSTVREYKRMRNNYFQKLMRTKVNDVTRLVVQQAVNDEAKRENALSPKTIKNAYGLLTAALAMAAPDLVLRTTLPVRVLNKTYKPTSEDIEKLLQVVQNTDMEIPVLLAATCTLRRGEIGAFDSIDFENSTITVHSSMIKTFDNKWVINPTAKSIAGNRTIEIPRLVMNRIEDRLKDGLPLMPSTPDQITRKFPKLLRKNDIPHFRFHDLRHYSASIMSMLNIPDKDAMERGGWTTNTVMKQTYQHAMKESRRSANEKINAFFNEKIENATRNATR